MNPAHTLRFVRNILWDKEHITLLSRHLFKITGPVSSDEEHLRAALEWIQHAYRQTNSTGIAGFYSLLEGWYDAYPETTGYIIETLLNYHKVSQDPENLDIAIQMADWELESRLPDGSVRGYCLPSGLSSTPVVFDTAQVIFGWSALYRATKIARYLSASEKAGVWLMNSLNPHGVWDLNVYRGHCGTYNARSAWAMLLSARDASREDIARAAVRFLRWVLTQQTPSGFFHNMGYLAHKQVFTHTIGYTLEGLVGSADELNHLDPQFSAELRESFLVACGRLLREYEETGTLFGEYRDNFKPVDKGFVCVTGTAQISGCFLKAYSLTNDHRYFQAASALLDDVKSMQNMWSTNPTFRGSFPGSFPIWRRYQRWRLVTWAAKFFIDAILEKNRLLQIQQEHPLSLLDKATTATEPLHFIKGRTAAGGR